MHGLTLAHSISLPRFTSFCLSCSPILVCLSRTSILIHVSGLRVQLHPPEDHGACAVSHCMRVRVGVRLVRLVLIHLVVVVVVALLAEVAWVVPVCASDRLEDFLPVLALVFD